MLELCPGGPDVCVDATGFRYAKEILHKVERFLRLETDAKSAIIEAIYLVKKFGHISVIGDYYGLTNHFPIGALFDKGITFRAGVVCVQKYWKLLLKYVVEGKVDLTQVITHVIPWDDGPSGYQIFDEQKNDCIKVILKPNLWILFSNNKRKSSFVEGKLLLPNRPDQFGRTCDDLNLNKFQEWSSARRWSIFYFGIVLRP